MSDPLLKWRDAFPVVNNTTYLISNSLGAMPQKATERLEDYTNTWKERGVRAWAETWWALPREFGSRLSSFLGAEEDTISMHLNVTLASASLVSCFDLSGTRNKIVYTDMNFPSLHYLYSQFPRNANCVAVPSDDGISVSTERLLDAIDDKTLLVPISHVLFRSSYIQDVQAVIEKAHRVGAHVMLDTYQSAGSLPLNFKELGVDFAVGGTLKWLCGGPGVAFLYTRPDLMPVLKPRLTGWLAHEQPFGFELDAMRYASDAYRFMNGTPNIPGLYAARAGLEILLEVGMDAIREKSTRQTSTLIERALELGFEVTAPRVAAQRAGTVAIQVPEARAVAAELLARDIIVDYRPKAGIRLSPHFYTKDDELELALTQIDEILKTHAYKKHLDNKSVVT